nr:phytochelatin synthase family protein [Anaplasma marginale]
MCYPKNGAFCGVASIIMVLNALSIPAPNANVGDFLFFNQDNFFDNPETTRIMTYEKISRSGMTLEELGKLLESYPVQAEVHHGSDLSLDRFRSLITDNLETDNDFVLINYLRSSIGQEKWGHISPIAAYDEDTDRFLILDVARYKYPPVWVKTEELWQSTRTLDRTSRKKQEVIVFS